MTDWVLHAGAGFRVVCDSDSRFDRWLVVTFEKRARAGQLASNLRDPRGLVRKNINLRPNLEQQIKPSSEPDSAGDSLKTCVAELEDYVGIFQIDTRWVFVFSALSKRGG